MTSKYLLVGLLLYYLCHHYASGRKVRPIHHNVSLILDYDNLKWNWTKVVDRHNRFNFNAIPLELY